MQWFIKRKKEELALKVKHINLKIKGYDYDKLYNETSDEDYDDYGVMEKKNM